MLGIFGFIAAAATFLLYSLSFRKIKIKKSTNVHLEYYQYAYILLALACVFWATGIIADDTDALINSIIFGNVALFSGTVLLAYGLPKQKYKLLLTIPLALMSVGFIIFRISAQTPDPYVEDGILIFNSSDFVSYVIGGTFIAAWLPASIYVTRLITEKAFFRPLRTIGTVSVVLSGLSVVAFLAADTPRAIVMSFAIMVCSFGPLIGINYLIRRGEKL